MSALISVGVPVYNGEAYLADALSALSTQTVDDLEIIVVDNASTDDSNRIALSAAKRDDRIRVVRNEKNVGAAHNFNRAFAESSGRYFKWAAHDDLCEPTFLERCLHVLETRPDVSLAYTATVDVDEDNRELHVTRGGSYAGSVDPLERAADILLRPSPCYEAFGLMRSHLLAETKLIGPFTSSDRVTLLEMALRGRFFEVDEPLFRRRRHATNSITANPDSKKRKAWFDSSATNRSYPKWRLGREYYLAAGRAAPHFHRGWRFDALLARWAAQRLRPLAGEAVDAFVDSTLKKVEGLRQMRSDTTARPDLNR